MPIFCLCGLEAGSRISRKENINKGRKYFSCSQLEENKCKFFKWEESNTLLLRKQPMPIVSNPICKPFVFIIFSSILLRSHENVFFSQVE